MYIKRMLAGICTAICIFFGLSAAQAATFTTVGTETAGNLPGNFDLSVLGIHAGSAALFANAAGSGIGVNGAANLTLTYFGSEAAFNNVFNFQLGDVVFSNAGTAIGHSETASVLAGGLLPFMFLSNGGAAVANGSGAGVFDSIAFVLLSSTDALLLFNDNATVDRDYDDMAIRVQISPVPIPPAALLLGAGLVGLAALGRRKKRIVS